MSDRYRIERELGAGGMATVYLAHDLKHDRKVALKVLKPELAAVIGATRFLAEIKTTANLQHPHILPLHDSGEVDGTVFYVMPFVEGESLRDRLTREKQLPIDDALRITTEVASALDYAHRKGVIHRDIKPENILLHEGQALVADFGIALAANATGGTRMTETGMSLGTPHYMSPEQAMGERSLDARADVYALGCVLYEMLIGEPPFTGPTAQAVVARVITGAVEPPVSRRPTVPANVNAAVLTALQKLPADRFATAALFAEALHDKSFSTAASRNARGGAGAAGSWNRITVAAMAVAIVALAAAGWAIATRSANTAPSVLRVSMELPDSFALLRGSASLALSPDGSRMVFAGGIANALNQKSSQRALWVRSRDQLEAVRVASTEGAMKPFFSADGQRVGYFAPPASLKVVDLGGGPPVTLVDTGVTRDGAAFGPDGAVYAVGRDGLVKFPVGGGSRVQVSKFDQNAGEIHHSAPDVLPNGRGVIFTIVRIPSSAVSLYDVAVLDLKTGKHRVLVRGVLGRYAAGFLVFVRADGVLAAARFDQEKLMLTGPEVPITSGVGTGSFGETDLAIGRDGTLAYVAGESTGSPADIIWVSRDGTVRPVDPTWRANFDGVSLSPDGTRLAVSVGIGLGEDVWVKQLDAGPRTKLTFGKARNHRPVWYPDGNNVAFLSEDNTPFSIVAKRADGNGETEVVAREARNIAAGIISPDGKWVIYRTSSSESGAGDILAKRIGDSLATPLLSTPADERHPALSPNGRWLAYRSDETGKNEVYVRPFPNVGDGKWAVSTAGGSDPVWAHSGRELFYINDANALVAATVVTQPTFSARAQRVLFTLPVGTRPNASSQRYDVTRDDQRFVMIRPVESEFGQEQRARLILVTNFFEELKAKVGVKK